MKALNRKLGRDLWRMKGQVFAITLVVVSGVATFIMFISTMDSLSLTRNRFYRDYFAQAHGFDPVFEATLHPSLFPALSSRGQDQ